MPYSVQSRYSYYEHMSRPHQHVLPHLQQSDWNRVIILLRCLILEDIRYTERYPPLVRKCRALARDVAPRSHCSAVRHRSLHGTWDGGILRDPKKATC